MTMEAASVTAAVSAEGRYAVFFAGRECGEERWRIEARDGGAVATGVQETWAPHPFPSRQEYRVAIDDKARLRGVEIRWMVGERRLLATHAADGATWRVKIEYGEHVKEQEGDYPDFCEVETTSHLSNTFILARRDFRVGGEHEFPVLRIGPPYMAVSPDRMMFRCEEEAMFLSPIGPIPAKRYVATVTGENSDSARYGFWADERGIVLESFEGDDVGQTWMKLVEYRRGS